jgi:2-desacetyl-2-hydroxyethyl bacteriochlorophyllide A dehydrogenase
MLGPRSLEVREIEVPDRPPSGGAILKIAVNGICGSDWDLYSGQLTSVPGMRFPLVPGHEMIGRVVQLDEAAEWDLEVGDRVAVESRIRCGRCRACLSGRLSQCSRASTYAHIPLDVDSGLYGGLSEYMVLLPGSSVFKVPDHVSDLDAALFNPLGNAFHWMLETAEVGVGDRVLVLGGGQRGLACAVVAREAGAAQVIVTGLRRDAHKLELATRFGATDVINVEEVDTVETVARLTGGEGVDLAVDTVPESLVPTQHGLQSLRAGGTLVVAGVKGEHEQLPIRGLLRGERRLVSSSATTPWSVGNALRVIAAGGYPFAELHSHTVGLEEAEWAIRLLGGEVEGQPLHVSVAP